VIIHRHGLTSLLLGVILCAFHCCCPKDFSRCKIGLYQFDRIFILFIWSSGNETFKFSSAVSPESGFIDRRDLKYFGEFLLKIPFYMAFFRVFSCIFCTKRMKILSKLPSKRHTLSYCQNFLAFDCVESISSLFSFFAFTFKNPTCIRDIGLKAFIDRTIWRPGSIIWLRH
jgi:hypothetical protein